MSPQRYRKSLTKAWRRVQNRLRRGRRVLVLGDSHSGVFEYCFDHGLLAPHWVNCEIVAGATAVGLNNDTSASGAWRKFDQALDRHADFDVVAIVLGECDCSFALWKKAERLTVAPETLIAGSLSGICRLIDRIRNGSAVPARKIIVVGAILPTVDTASAAGQENLLRREIKASQAERTRLVLDFNEQLRQLAAMTGIAYFDLTAQTRDPATGLIDRRFVADAGDHHISHPASARLWASQLVSLL